VQGADPAAVRRAVETGDPLPGTAGFAGHVDEMLVRDVLGRYPLFVESEDAEWPDDPTWATDPNHLDEPLSFPAGHVQHEGQQPQHRWSLPDPAPF